MKIIIRNCIYALIMLGPMGYFGYYGKPVEMGIAVVTSALTIAFMNIDRLIKIRGAGFEAEMEQAVKEAYVTIEEMNRLKKVIIRLGMNLILYHNRWEGIPEFRSKEIKLVLLEMSKKLNESGAVVDYAEVKQLASNCGWQLFYEFRNQFKEDQTIFNKFGEIKGDYVTIIEEDGYYEPPSIDEINKIILENNNSLNVSQEKSLLEYKNFVKQHLGIR